MYTIAHGKPNVFAIGQHNLVAERLVHPNYNGNPITEHKPHPVQNRNPKSDSGANGNNQLNTVNVAIFDADRISHSIPDAFRDGNQAVLRLPSEAEWEYACRANTTTRFSFGDSLSVNDLCEDDGVRSQNMWYCGNNPSFGEPGYGTKAVGGKLVNGFGLYDMHGNVWEWCEDWYHTDYTGAPGDGSAWVLPTGTEHVIRGGVWHYSAGDCRSSSRNKVVPTFANADLGFRLALTAE